jgi:hypothetical protein
MLGVGNDHQFAIDRSTYLCGEIGVVVGIGGADDDEGWLARGEETCLYRLLVPRWCESDGRRTLQRFLGCQEVCHCAGAE